jgi:hypothetical protein
MWRCLMTILRQVAQETDVIASTEIVLRQLLGFYGGTAATGWLRATIGPPSKGARIAEKIVALMAERVAEFARLPLMRGNRQERLYETIRCNPQYVDRHNCCYLLVVAADIDRAGPSNHQLAGSGTRNRHGTGTGSWCPSHAYDAR